MIPDEAVEAAVEAFWATGTEPNVDRLMAALEAAAPHLMASALNSAAHAMELMPPLLRAQYVEALRLYAAEPWRLGTSGTNV